MSHGYCTACLEHKIEKTWCWKCGQKTGTYSETSAVAMAQAVTNSPLDRGCEQG